MRVFVAGATGATGQAFVAEGSKAGLDLVLHVRPQTAPRTPLGKDTRARIFELADSAALDAAILGCDAVVSFIGTMKKRFAAGDTYESSDVGTTALLVEAAGRTGVPRMLLLSSTGAGGVGAYLKMKQRCEDLVRQSRLRWTIFRPSFLVTPGDVPEGTHGKRRGPPGLGAFAGVLRGVPGLKGWTDDVRPLPVDVLARAFVRVLERPLDGDILDGRHIWQLAG